MSLKNALKNWQKLQVANGFLACSLDEVGRKDSIFQAILYLGNRYEWAMLRKGNLSDNDLEKIGFRTRFLSNKNFNYKELAKWMERILVFYENNGYPFASVQLHQLNIKTPQKVSAELLLKKGTLYRFSTIKLEDDSTGLSIQYLQNYLDIRPKSLYNQLKISALKNKLKALPFIVLDKEPYVSFDENKATLHLHLKKKAANRFDVLLGFQPENQANTPTSQRFTVTGNLNLDLYNTLNRGERFTLDFQRFKAQQQQLKASVNYPFLFQLPIGLDANIAIVRQDTAFSTAQYAIGGRFLFVGNNYIKLFWQVEQNNLLKINRLQIISEKKLPVTLDVDVNAYGIEWVQQRLDYRFNPRKGWALQLKTDVGTRRISKNNRIIQLQDKNNLAFDFATLYDSLRLRTLRLQVVSQLEIYLPIMEQSTFKIALQTNGFFTTIPLYKNEQYRIGGNRQLRGFDESSIFASRFVLSTLEYRFLFGQNSFFNIFSDIAFTDNTTSLKKEKNRYLSVGAGMSFETRAGIFSLNYALGKTNNNSLDVRNGKIHFGYVSLF